MLFKKKVFPSLIFYYFSRKFGCALLYHLMSVASQENMLIEQAQECNKEFCHFTHNFLLMSNKQLKQNYAFFSLTNQGLIP